jgi:phospholipase/lecithinase/hemolysin
MKGILRRGLLVAALVFVAVAPARAMVISSVVSFGDSNVDTGNLAAAGAAIGVVINGPPNFQGRNSNGPLVTEYLAQMIHRPLLNYAFSGANTGTGFNFGLAKNTLSQITDYLTGRGGVADPNALYVYWAGSNDLLGMPAAPSLAARLAFTEANVTAGLTALSNAGATRIIVANRTPRPDLAGANNGWGLDLNARLASFLPGLDATLAADLLIFDSYSLMADMVNNPGNYGFTRVGAGDLCINDPVCRADLDEGAKWTNWDAAHKTTRVHELTAMAIVEEFGLPVPAPAAAWLFGLALAGLGAMRGRGVLARA